MWLSLVHSELIRMKRVLFLFLFVLLNILAQAAHKVFGSGAIYEEQSSISGYQLYSLNYGELK